MSKKPAASKPKQTEIDVEIKAIGTILAALASLASQEDRDRVMEYIRARVEDPETIWR